MILSTDNTPTTTMVTMFTQYLPTFTLSLLITYPSFNKLQTTSNNASLSFLALGDILHLSTQLEVQVQLLG